MIVILVIQGLWDLPVLVQQRIFVTHMHGDHVFGLMGLLASCGLGVPPQKEKCGDHSVIVPRCPLTLLLCLQCI